MRAWALLVLPMALAIVMCISGAVTSQTPPTPPTTNTVTLPVTEIVLYANGLGHFRRAGDVDGKANIELSAPATEMNDLLKSLTIDGTSTSAPIVYDSPEPIETALPTYAIDLSSNPTLGELLQLARGEAVEIMLNSGAGEVVGSILGMEEREEQPNKFDVVNLWTDLGVRSVPISQIRAVRFRSAKLDAEVRRALAMIAGQRDAGRKTLRMTLPGDGHRRVGLSYVAEAPVWKASYRLVTDANNKSRLQGLALVENTTADDWQNVRVTLAGGRPVSFQMDLYPSLFTPRPIVEPEQFAALRPPSYSGPNNGFAGGTSNVNLGFGGGAQGTFGAGGGGLSLGAQGFLGGGSPESGTPASKYRRPRSQFLAAASLQSEGAEPVSYEKYKNRVLEKRGKDGDENTLRIVSEIAEDPLGEPARYSLSQQLSIPRLKSAMVPFMDEAVEATSVSVYSPDVHAKRALQAYRIKNTTKKPWVSGPVSVARADGYAGDARISDWLPNEERLIAFALDSGCECRRVTKPEPEEIVRIRIERGQIEETKRHRERTQYEFRHHAGPDRTLWVEHPAPAGWTVVPPTKAEERTKDRLRFKTELTANKPTNLEVTLERQSVTKTDLGTFDSSALSAMIALPATSPAVKQSLKDFITLRERLSQSSTRLTEARKEFAEASEEQARLRPNLERVPNGSAVQKEMLEKMGRYEATIDTARQKIAAANNDEKVIMEELRNKMAQISAE